MTEYLVTGAAGFIGSQVARRLLQEGNTVVGLDNLNQAYDVRLKQWRLRQLEEFPEFRFHKVDISDWEALEEGWGAYRFEAVFNLAARAGVRASVIDPWIYARANVTGALNVLEMCRRREVKKLVQASTSSLYGSQTPRPFSEDADISRPLSPYTATKGASELLCHTYHSLYGLDVSVLRYFTVYGPAGRPDMSIFRFIQWISEGTPVRVFGDGHQERDFTYVEDISRGTVAALREVGYEVINLGSDRPIVLLDIIRLIGNMLERTPRIEHLPEAPADVRSTWADINKAKSLLSWEPKTDIEAGLRHSIEWYRAERSWAREVDTSD